MSAHNRLVLGQSTALLTGATGGIGQAIARALAQRGTRLILSGRRAEELERCAADVGGRAIVADLGARDNVERLGAEAAAAGVDVLIANAAHPATGALEELSQDQIDAMLEVNLRAPIALARALAPEMARRGSGHLVFVSSLSGKFAGPASSLYSATKFGLRGFAFGLREDLRADGVGVSVVSPGFIRDAGMFSRTGVQLPPGTGTRSPEDVATAVITAIERNRIEVDVAPAPLRLGAAFALVAPGVASRASRVMGSDRIGRQMAEAQRHQG